MNSNREIRRQSFGLVPETCPIVDAALSAACEEIKAQTNKLREALDSQIERAMEAEDLVEDLGLRVAELESELEILRSGRSEAP